MNATRGEKNPAEVERLAMQLLPYLEEWRPGAPACTSGDFDALTHALGKTVTTRADLLYFLAATSGDEAERARRHQAILQALLYWEGAAPGSGLEQAVSHRHEEALHVAPGTLKQAALDTLREIAPPEPQQESSETPALHTISAQELQGKQLAPVRFVVVDMLPQGLALLASPPKFGKSWFVLDLCLSVSAGADFLCRQSVKSGCLYLALEDSERRLKDRMEKILQGRRAPAGFDYAVSALGIDNGLLEQLDGYLRQHPGTGLIVIDTLQKVRGATGGKENAYSADYREVGALKSFADRHGICLLLVHHLRKMKDDTDPFNQISGTNGIFGAADTAMVMTRAKRGDANTYFSIIGRDIDSSDSVLVFDKAAYRWRSLGSADLVERSQEEEAYKHDPIAATIRELLREKNTGEWCGTMKDLMAAGERLTGEWLAETPQSMTRKVQKLAPLLFRYDGIAWERKSNGTGGGKHRFRVSNVGSLPLIVGGEQLHAEGTE